MKQGANLAGRDIGTPPCARASCSPPMHRACEHRIAVVSHDRRRAVRPARGRDVAQARRRRAVVVGQVGGHGQRDSARSRVRHPKEPRSDRARARETATQGVENGQATETGNATGAGRRGCADGPPRPPIPRSQSGPVLRPPRARWRQDCIIGNRHFGASSRRPGRGVLGFGGYHAGGERGQGSEQDGSFAVGGCSTRGPRMSGGIRTRVHPVTEFCSTSGSGLRMASCVCDLTEITDGERSPRHVVVVLEREIHH